jgi:hypothetical protein
MVQAGKVSPKKVRFDQINGLVKAQEVLILRNRDLFIPDRKTIINPVKKRIPRVRLVL